MVKATSFATITGKKKKNTSRRRNSRSVMGRVVTGVPQMHGNSLKCLEKNQSQQPRKTATDSSNFETECILAILSQFQKFPLKCLCLAGKRNITSEEKRIIDLRFLQVFGGYSSVQWNESTHRIRWRQKNFLRAAWNEPVIFLVLRHPFYRERPYQPEQSGSPIQSSVTANRVFKSHKSQTQYKRAFSFSLPKLAYPHCFR